MNVEKLDFSQTHAFTPIFLDYLAQKEALSKFYNRPPQLGSFADQRAEKQLAPEVRNDLVKVLKQQYDGLETTEAVRQNIDALASDQTYTITTGHQLNIFSGPLFFIYKLVTTINACRQLSEEYPDHRFVPIYWMASEDHDFAEINHFHLFGQRYQWETEQQGAVGRFGLEGMEAVLSALPEAVPLFERAYREHDTLAAATRYYVNELLGAQGLLVLDADDATLKRHFAPVIQDDALNHSAKKLVEDASQRLDELDYRTQVHPRDINLFYLTDQQRERLVREGDGFAVNNTDQRFSEAELQQEMEAHPERFSPNVVLRPLYQEMILPNLGYVGGPGELAYWLQLRPMFDHYQVPFPVLLPRNFALVVSKSNAKKLQKVGLETHELFADTDALIKDFVENNADASLSLGEQKAALAKVYEDVEERVLAVDGSLKGFIGAESSKAFKSLDNIEKRLKKAEEQKQETAVGQLESLKEKLFPDGGLQERHENLLTYHINNPQFIDELLEKFDPFDLRFNVLMEE
ncbi:MAG: bacillithiol biosynthesis cysteine-adding enzyme BshC [Tunicatimonas sp.]